MDFWAFTNPLDGVQDYLCACFPREGVYDFYLHISEGIYDPGKTKGHWCKPRQSDHPLSSQAWSGG